MRSRQKNRVAAVSEPAGWTAWVGGEYDSPLTTANANRQFAKGRKTYFLLLDIARQLFAKHGYHGTSVRDIAIAAEVNSGAVSYNFGTKKELYSLVLRGFTQPLVTNLARLDRATRLSPTDRIQEWTRLFCAHAEQHRELIPLLAREMASTAEPEIPVTQLFERLIPQLSDFITEGQQSGEIREGDPLTLSLSLIGQIVFLHLARKTTKAAMERDFNPSTEDIRTAVNALIRK